MQIKIYTIPMPGGEALTEDMNLFLRSKKVLDMTEHILNSERGAHLASTPELCSGNIASNLPERSSGVHTTTIWRSPPSSPN